MAETLEIGGATEPAPPSIRAPRHTQLPQAGCPPEPNHVPSAATPSDEGQLISEALTMSALVGNLTMEARRYTDLRRAHQRLDLQCKAMARYASDGDKTAGAKLYTAAMKDPTHPLRVWLQPYLDAMAPLAASSDWQAKLIANLAQGLPVADWAEGIAGLSPRFLGLIVGECGTPPGDFRNPSCVWKRMGMAVIGEGRQRRVAGDAAIEHGYVARRRALMWNVGESIIKQQLRSQKDEQGKKIDGTDYAIGPYGEVYLARKAYERRRVDSAGHAHSRAKRYMEKRLLREMWQAWRANCAP